MHDALHILIASLSALNVHTFLVSNLCLCIQVFLARSVFVHVLGEIFFLCPPFLCAVDIFPATGRVVVCSMSVKCLGVKVFTWKCTTGS